MAGGHRLWVQHDCPGVYTGLLCRPAARATRGAWHSAGIQAEHLMGDRARNGLSGACKTYRHNPGTRSFRVLVLEDKALLVEPATGAWRRRWLGAVFSLQFLPFR